MMPSSGNLPVPTADEYSAKTHPIAGLIETNQAKIVELVELRNSGVVEKVRSKIAVPDE